MVPAPLLASDSITAQPLERNQAAQRFVASGSAWSTRFSTTSRGLPAVSWSMSGFRLETGIRASTISHTASTFLICSAIIRRVLVM